MGEPNKERSICCRHKLHIVPNLYPQTGISTHTLLAEHTTHNNVETKDKVVYSIVETCLTNTLFMYQFQGKLSRSLFIPCSLKFDTLIAKVWMLNPDSQKEPSSSNNQQ